MHDALLLPFNTYARFEEDMNHPDRVAESRDLIDRQNSILMVIEGTRAADDLFDQLAEQGIEPGDYVHCVESNVNHLIDIDFLR